MTKRLTWLVGYCIILGALFSCFEIKENIVLKNDGSGTYSFLMDLSQIKPLFTMSRDFNRSFNDSTSKLKTNLSAPNPLLQMKVKFDALQQTLEAVDGISNYKTVCDTTSYIIGATYSFKNIESLNKSINVLRSSSENPSNGAATHYTYDSKHFSKINDISKADITGPSSKNDSLTTELFKTARYTLTCTFEKKIKDVSNPLYFISADGKTLFYSGSMLDIMTQKNNIGNEVILQ
ncbi:hypothetical protein [uncultured Cytophaga sp.]|uniref:hypothetical protein n=1 Tax=uncultured Cytophaga sp. TaxID=160238 RepID=UPI002610BD57|nr:hypothetical protein [uncultured Cytophaga sp.]